VNRCCYTSQDYTEEGFVTQLHKRFTTAQVKALLDQYEQGHITRKDVQEVLTIGKTRFFSLLADYQQNRSAFALSYERSTPGRLPQTTEEAMQRELLREKAIVEDKRLPLSGYNYSAVQDRLLDDKIRVSLPTLIERAKQLGCYKPPHKTKAHDRQVLTATIGDLIQHDASHHLWSPYASTKWTLITSLDDYSRRLLYADFVPAETSWAHIRAAEQVMRQYGLPFRYYVDSLRVFRFVRSRDSLYAKQVLGTDETDPQWRQVLRLLGVEVIYALSPQAKGKIERPYRWLQDRIVRTCALEKLTTIDEARSVLRHELERYNTRQVHSTTGEIPQVRFEQAQAAGQSLLRPFVLPAPYRSTKDVFCLRETRMVDGYRRISVHGHVLDVPQVEVHEEVEVHFVPDLQTNLMELRIWWQKKMVLATTCPLGEFTVHL
jgi:hypothetical protein